jgi:hypothetical protein|uniref:Uncharacterized protein n=1 Tax=Eutreptiella gymnastica TaxID=73025 RepID=A0A7S4CWL8_9EUGL|eukprot:CAMPEP_0174283618 /NCGR_PEP_ID=MMETSP0809-20121228/4321_1 /TAXON_ID=73025 ORGANISM="Eutreptiella gymnastica-like, Strain CCMP1594" /NCGR_SAMPLE_ID=MMETSP0809 /ASSEMBLY_ACC=CAM_ASM_000658 /LENGTH=279 /DNA_ID=CAMNT_0015378671 /DNA_START=53 /DNA_END=892 /DNA_ORIENTATION=-
MAKAPKNPYAPVHPAKKLLTLALALLGLSVLLGFISVFVPWSQRDFNSTASRLTAWFYPFKWCVENKLSSLHYMQCEDEDFGGWTTSAITGFSVPLAGNLKCRGFFIATVVFVFIHVIIGVFALIFLAACLAKLWTKLAKPLALLAAILTFISFAGSLCSWAMFIVYAEEKCSSDTVNGVNVYPLQGYSYGFILEIFATALALGAMLLACLGLTKVLKHKPHTPAYPMQAAAYPAAAYMPQYMEPYPAMPPYAPAMSTSPYMEPAAAYAPPMYPMAPMY